MRKLHMEHVKRWAKFIRENPGDWQEEHTRFINSQFLQHEVFVKNLLKQKDGMKKLIKLYDIKNERLIKSLKY